MCPYEAFWPCFNILGVNFLVNLGFNQVLSSYLLWILKIAYITSVRDLVKTASNKSKYFHDKLLFLKMVQMIQMILFTKQKQTHRASIYGCQGQRTRGRDREVGIDMYKLLYLKRIISKVLLYSTGNSSQRYSPDGRGVWGRMDTCLSGWDPILSTWNYPISSAILQYKIKHFKNDKNKEGSGGTLIQQSIWILKYSKKDKTQSK